NKFVEAEGRAFKMKNCELKELGSEVCKKEFVEVGSDKDWMMRTNLFFSSEISMQNFVKLGMSSETSKSEKLESENKTSYHLTRYGKASLKFDKYLEPTKEFKKAVEDAIKSKNPSESFKRITDEYGQFISTEVILGGRVHFDEFKGSISHSKNNSREIHTSINALEMMNSQVGGSTSYSEGSSNHYNYKCTNLFGGKQPDSLEHFNEKAWIESLEDYKNWDCIEFRDPVSIFQVLPKNLRDEIIELVGKRIHYSKIEEYENRLDQLDDFGKPKILKLNIPSDFLKNNDKDYNIFATVVDKTKSKNDFFTCQVYWPQNGKPSLLIHCVQKRFKKRVCNLKIGWMVIGYDTDFTFILTDLNTQLKILKNDQNDFNTLNNSTM